jgi:hypothetical protein
VLQRIAVVPALTIVNGKDISFCMEKEPGNFSIADMYIALCNFDDNQQGANWMNIWRLRVPERVKTFVWLLHHDRLLTNFNKSKMGLGSSMCNICGNIVESTA